MTNNPYGHWKCIFLFPAAILYEEILFRIFTAGRLFSSAFFPTLCFSLAYGGIGYLLASLSKRKRVNRLVTGALLVLAAIPYIVQFFIYKQFKQFYGFNTMTGGAGDALTSYTGEVLRLIFLRGGIFVTLLFFTSRGPVPGFRQAVDSGDPGEKGYPDGGGGNVRDFLSPGSWDCIGKRSLFSGLRFPVQLSGGGKRFRPSHGNASGCQAGTVSRDGSL